MGVYGSCKDIVKHMKFIYVHTLISGFFDNIEGSSYTTLIVHGERIPWRLRATVLNVTHYLVTTMFPVYYTGKLHTIFQFNISLTFA